MSAHSVLRAVAACAPGKRVVVSVPSGVIYELPIVPEPARPDPPHPLEVFSQQLLERDVQARAEVAAVAARADESLAAVKDAVAELAARQDEGVKEIVGTLHLPVKPVYFPDGKLRHAQRVKPGA